jgi:predicted nuclease with TOPRIM domain
MQHSKRDLIASEKDELLEVIEELRSKLKKKHALLTKTRSKLSLTRTQLKRMKDTVVFQRERIIELYPEATSKSESNERRYSTRTF